MEKYNLTIGIPIKNEEESIEKCLRFILRSTLLENIEIIVCDNGSTDKSLDIVSKIKNEKIKIIKEARLGRIFAMNRIIKESLSDYVIFCDADILVKKDTFQGIYEGLRCSDLHLLGIQLVDISKDRFFDWYYKWLPKIHKDDEKDNIMGGCFGINKTKFGKFPDVLSTDFFMSAHYHYGNKKAFRDDSIKAYYKRANTVGDILMKMARNRIKYLQMRRAFPKLVKFPYITKIDWRRFRGNFGFNAFLVFLVYSFFEVTAYASGTTFFYIKLGNVGYGWKKARSTKLHDVDVFLWQN